ncbi:MAG: type II toxin-antitoxin system death-on-curing family toxin [Candidatus Odyssella sp.]|nr:type II toxin-antitoxin system death-on-curing family toxin [Candidatus Odyssella sp.]
MTEPVWLTRALVEAIQDQLITEHGGSHGLRDEGLLESALARAPNKNAYGAPSLAELAAAYAFGLCRNHAFIDGNKRIALAVADVFLQLNGHELVAPEAEAVVMTLELAAGACSESEYAAWIAAHMQTLEPEK